MRPLRLTEKARWARADDHKLISPSPERRDPPCEYADRCGGCDWIAWERDAQLAGKASLAADALTRIGGLETEPPEVISAGGELGWRGRVRLSVSRDGRSVGFKARGSHDVVDIERCAVATDAVNDGLAAVRAATRIGGLRGVEGVTLRSAPDGAPVVARVHTRGRLPAGTRRSLGALREALPEGRAADRAGQRWPLHGAWIAPRVDSFTQVHDAANVALVGLVLRMVGEVDGLVVDACSGAGNFALPLAAAGRSVRAFDLAGGAIEDLGHAAAAQGLAIPTRVGGMKDEIERLVGEDVGVVVLDPPRKGAKEAIPALLALAPTRLVYVACDPASLGRDARALTAGGYALTQLTCVDLFPQTHHVETVAVFDRTDAQRGTKAPPEA